MARVGKRKWVWVGAAVLGCVIVLIAIALWPPAKPEAEIVFIEAEKVLREPNRLQRWVEALRAKMVKPPAAVKPRLVEIQVEIFTSDMLRSMENAAELIGGKPLAKKDGAQVWIRNYFDDLNRNSNPLMIGRRFISNPRMMMEEGKIGSTFIGNSMPLGGTNIDVGLMMRMKAFRGGTNDDLFLSVTDTKVMTGSNEVASAMVRTNFHVGARIQVPPQHRVLLVCDRKDGKGPVCVLVSAKWLPIK